MNFFKNIVLFFLCSFILLISSCANKNENQIIIKFWAMGTEAEYVIKLVPEFEKRNPNIKVLVQAIPWTAAQEKLITAFASDNTPDACQLGNTWVPQFATLDAIIKLDDFITASTIIEREKYFEGIWDTNVLDSIVYGIPWYIDTRLMFYRKDIFEKVGYSQPPKSWEELYDLSKKIKSLYPEEEKYAIYLPTNEWSQFIIFGLQNKAVLLKENNSQGNFSSDEFKEAF
jgi:multiple sugar transport system substrate-binding protein